MTRPLPTDARLRSRRHWISGCCVVAAGLLALRATTPSLAPAAAPISTGSGTAAVTAAGTATAAGVGKDSIAKEPAAKEAAAKEQPAKNGKNLRGVPGFTPEREAAALTFVRSHHPELAALLDRLKVRQPHEYQKAVRDLFRVSERLAASRDDLPLRYELELKQWKLTSRIQMLSARLSMGRIPEQEQELKQLLAEQLEAHRELIAFNLERASARVAGLTRELDDLNANKQSILDAKFDKAMKAADQRKADQRKPVAKNGAAAEKKAETKSDE